MVENDASLLGREGLIRILRSLVADELKETRASAGLSLKVLQWDADENLRDGQAELDSLELDNVTSRISEYFRLFETGVEDLLMAKPWFNGWADTLLMALPHGSGQVTVQTSGTTGTPKNCTHHIETLAFDARAVAEIVKSQRVLSNVPPHHVYGLIYSCLMPALSELEHIELRDQTPRAATDLMGPGDVFVTNPFLLKNFVRQIDRFPDGVTILTSSAPMPDAVVKAALAKGATRIIDIYGSSETLGVGWRACPSPVYTLFDGCSLDQGAEHLQRADGRQMTHALMDHLVPGEATQTFTLGGRRDGAIELGGINVFPSSIEAAIAGVPGVEDVKLEVMISTNGIDKALIARIKVAWDSSFDVVVEGARQHVSARFGDRCVPTFQPARAPQDRTRKAG